MKGLQRPGNNEGGLTFPLLVDQTNQHDEARRDQPSRLPAPRRSLVDEKSIIDHLSPNEDHLVDPEDIRDLLQLEYNSSATRIRRSDHHGQAQNINDSSSEESSQEGQSKEEESGRSENDPTSIQNKK